MENSEKWLSQFPKSQGDMDAKYSSMLSKRVQMEEKVILKRPTVSVNEVISSHSFWWGPVPVGEVEPVLNMDS